MSEKIGDTPRFPYPGAGATMRELALFDQDLTKAVFNDSVEIRRRANDSLQKDGKEPMTGPLDLGGFDILNVSGYSSLDAALDLAFYHNGSRAMTGDLDVNTNNLIDVGTHTGEFYETGAWTPELNAVPTPGSPTYSAQGGYYTRVGRLVVVSFRIVVSALGGATSQLRLGNLPFAHTLQGDAANRETLNIGFYDGFDAAPADATHLYGFFQDSSTDVRLYWERATLGLSTTAVTDSHYVSGALTMYGSFAYNTF